MNTLDIQQMIMDAVARVRNDIRQRNIKIIKEALRKHRNKKKEQK